MDKPPSDPELLSPAGDMASLVAAVQNGADAVYLGQTAFSARQKAKNFTGETLKEAVSYCHARGVQVYQTLNTVVFDKETDALVRCVENACGAGVDALIVQDLGVIRAVRALCPEMPLHGSTQMSVHSPAGARFLKELGLSRVVLAREMSLEEIRDVTRVGIETEVFIHGALCMSVSGQCYLSALLGGRSGNRGCCAGPCRLPFTADQKPAFDLSLKDLCLIEQLSALKELGVTSLKIEGRLKRPGYVAAATAAYRHALDGQDYDMDILRSVFSRSGFTDSYFTGRISGQMFGTRQKEDVTAATASLLRSLEEERPERGRVPLSLTLEVQAGKPLRLTGTDGDGNRAAAEGEPPEAALRQPLRPDVLEASLQKLGGTIFTPHQITVSLGEGLQTPLSRVNALRRQVCEELLARRSTVSPRSFSGQLPPDPPPVRELFTFLCRFASFAGMPTGLADRMTVILPVEEVLAHQSALLPVADRVIVEPDRALFGQEERVFGLLKQAREAGFSRLFVQNPSHLVMGRTLSYTMLGAPFLNVTNRLAAAEWQERGLSALCGSFELTLAAGCQLSPPLPFGMTVYGRLPLMLLRSCPIRHRLNCARCGGQGVLTDRMSARFPVICHGRRYTELLNSVPLDLSDKIDTLQALSFGLLYFTGETAEQAAEILSRFELGGDPVAPYTRGLSFKRV